MRREPRDTAEQATRREPQLGAELRRDETRREDEDEKQEQQFRFTFPAEEELFWKLWTWDSPKLPRKTYFAKLAHCALLWLLLIRVLLPQFLFLWQILVSLVNTLPIT